MCAAIGFLTTVYVNDIATQNTPTKRICHRPEWEGAILENIVRHLCYGVYCQQHKAQVNASLSNLNNGTLKFYFLPAK